jgi:hypothetical protein
VESLESSAVSMFFDIDGMRLRTDVHDDGKVVSVIRDFTTHTKHILTTDVSDVRYDTEVGARSTRRCIKEPLDLSQTDFSAPTRHTKSPHEVLLWHATGAESYVGRDYARGVECTQWYAEAEEAELVEGHVIKITSKRNH